MAPQISGGLKKAVMRSRSLHDLHDVYFHYISIGKCTRFYTKALLTADPARPAWDDYVAIPAWCIFIVCQYVLMHFEASIIKLAGVMCAMPPLSFGVMYRLM